MFRSVKTLIGAEIELIVDLAGLGKKELNTLSNFELKIILVRFHKK